MFYLRLIVSVSVSVIVLAFIPWNDFIELSHWNQLIGRYLLLAGILALIDRVVIAWRWHLLINDPLFQPSFYASVGHLF